LKTQGPAPCIVLEGGMLDDDALNLKRIRLTQVGRIRDK